MSFWGRIINRRNTHGGAGLAQFAPSAEARQICPDLCRAWEAALTDYQTLGWTGDNGITPTELRTQLPTIRNRCREAAKNNPYVVRAVRLWKNNIIGAGGIKLSMDVPTVRGGKDIDLEASDKVERAWRSWAESPEYCDIEGRKSLIEILQLAVRDWKVEGEAILHIAHSSLNPFGVELKVYRPDALAIDCIREPQGNKRGIYNGVEVDGLFRPRGFWFHKAMLPNGQYTGELFRVPARQILHLFDQDAAEQTRGVSALASVLKDLRMLQGYAIAELIAARVDAARVGTWKQMDGGDPTKVGDLVNGLLTQTTEPGEDRVVPFGWDYKGDSPSRPNAGFGPFMKDCLKRISGGLNLPYNILANDLEGVNYSSIRAGTLEDREGYKLDQQAIIDRILRPLFRRQDGWLDSFLKSPRGVASGLTFDDAARIREADTWLARRWDWVDPASEAAAREIAVAHHWTTDSDIAAESGKDYYTNVDTAKQEAEWRAAKGVEQTEVTPNE